MKFPKHFNFARLKRRVLSHHVWIVRGVIILSFAFLLALITVFVTRAVRSSSLSTYSHWANIFIFTPDSTIHKFENRTNILLLGKAGAGNTAPDLTDTILVASINHTTASIDLISIPRDIWIEKLRAKINSVYYWGNQKKQGGGLILAKSTVEEFLGVPIHYAVVVDFAGFEKVIDTLGGVSVDVEKTFTDTEFPIRGRENDLCGGDPLYRCRYETITFNQGTQMMDGATALKYVRSRHSDDKEEGTDTARNKRQQRVLTGIQKKILDKDILFSPKKLIEIRDVLLGITETDLQMDPLIVLAKRAIQSGGKFNSHFVPEDLLLNPPIISQYDRLYVFIPNDKTGDAIRNWVKGILYSK